MNQEALEHHVSRRIGQLRREAETHRLLKHRSRLERGWRSLNLLARRISNLKNMVGNPSVEGGEA